MIFHLVVRPDNAELAVLEDPVGATEKVRLTTRFASHPHLEDKGLYEFTVPSFYLLLPAWRVATLIPRLKLHKPATDRSCINNGTSWPMESVVTESVNLLYPKVSGNFTKYGNVTRTTRISITKNVTKRRAQHWAHDTSGLSSASRSQVNNHTDDKGK